EFIASKLVKLMIEKDIQIKKAKVLILGITFKENCPDLRNTKVVDVYKELLSYGMSVDIYDPWASAHRVKDYYNVDLLESLSEKEYDAILLAVAHNEFIGMDFASLKK